MKFTKYLVYTLLINTLLSAVLFAQPRCIFTSCSIASAERYVKYNQYMEAACTYSCFLRTHPQAKNVYIDYADVERILENYYTALCILNEYANKFGIDEEYLSVKARIFSDAGFYNSALNINTKLLRNNPNNTYIIATQASVLDQSGRPKAALSNLNHLMQINPNSGEIDYLNESVRAPLQSSFSIGARYSDLSLNNVLMDIPNTGQYIYQNDSVEISRIPLLLKVFLNPNTNLLFQGLYEHGSANRNSGLTTIDGQTTINDKEFQVGMEYFSTAFAKFRASAGGLFISNGHKFLVYNLGGNFLLTECLDLSLEFVHELFRPIDLTNGSPLEVSLGILETGGRAHINYKTSLQSSVDVDFRISILSRDNSYARLAIEPGTVLYNTNISTLEGGINLEFLSFNKQRQDGYYSPRFYQSYEPILLYKLRPKDNLLFQFLYGVGATRDNNSGHFGLATDASIETRYTYTKNVDLVAQVDYLYRGISPAYYEAGSSIGITWRF